MKTFFRVTVLGLLMTVMMALAAPAIMAQTDAEQKEKEALYNTFVANYDKKDIKNAQIAIDAAKTYIKKFPNDKQYVDYFKPQVAYLEGWIKDENKRIAEKAKTDARNKRLARLNTAFNAIEATPKDSAKWDEYFAAGENVLSFEPSFVDVSIVLASAGSEIPEEIVDPKYSALTVKYANKVISQLNSGTPSKKFGEFRWVYGSKDKALTWMNLILAAEKSKTNKDAAISYYYKATKFNEGSKNWNLYRLIGNWYRTKAVKLFDERKLLNIQNDDEFAKAKDIFAMERGLADRAIDAFARSYSLAKVDPKATAKQKTALYKSLKELFVYRYSEKSEAPLKTDANINRYVSTIRTKSMPDPSTKVNPVALPNETPSEKPAEMKKADSKTEEMKAGATRSRTVSKKSDN